MLPMMIICVTMFVAVAVLAFAAFSRWNAQSHPSPPTPEDILTERFARGEIDATEYRQRIEALHGKEPIARL
jgi:putative membrane protein